MTVLRDFLRRAASILLLSLLAQAPAALAEGIQDVARLVKQGQHAQALEQVDRFLSANPKDAQARFLKGVILTEMKRTPEAIAIFTKLTEDYPALPEPYNNLAVIYAQQKNYDKARQALEMAIRTHPSYATAHENLGDIYARMASQAYDKALQLDSSNATAQTKLAMIRDLISVAPRAGRVTAPAAITPAAVPTPSVPPAVAPAEPPKPAPSPAPAPVEAKRPVPAPAPVAAAEPAPTGAQDDIARVVNAWASAWSAKDIKAYLGFYAPAFKTPGGMKRAEWEAERRSRVTKPGAIQVSVDGLTVRSEGPDRAIVRFRQNYRSASLKSSSGKILVMTRSNGRWLIEQERIGG